MPATPAGSSANESSTSDPENSSAATANEQPNEPTTNSTTTTETTGTANTTEPTTADKTFLPTSTPSSTKPPASSTGQTPRADKLNPTQLTPRDQATLELIGLPLSHGWKENELADKLERPQSWVSDQLADLRIAIGLQQGIFPPLTDTERAALKDSIAEHGVLEPVHVNHNTVLDTLEVFDGRNRIAIARELVQEGTLDDLESIRYLTYEDLSSDEMSTLEFTLNASRRQLDRKQKRKLVEHQLQRDAGRSDRMIAAICGVDHTTVSNIRQDLAEQWAIHNAPHDDDDRDDEFDAVGILEDDAGLVDEITLEKAEALQELFTGTTVLHDVRPVAKPTTTTTVNEPLRVTPFTPTHRIGRDGIAQTSTPERLKPPEREWTIGPATCPHCQKQSTLVRIGERHILRA